jgi:site-specific recombinase XerD
MSRSSEAGLLCQLKIPCQFPESQGTLSSRLFYTALQNYFIWLVGKKVLTVSPMGTMPLHKITSPLPEILFEEECKKLLTTASSDSRLYLMMLLIVETGMKFEELAELEVNKFDLSNAYAPEVWIKHTGKKIKKERRSISSSQAGGR